MVPYVTSLVEVCKIKFRYQTNVVSLTINITTASRLADFLKALAVYENSSTLIHIRKV